MKKMALFLSIGVIMLTLFLNRDMASKVYALEPEDELWVTQAREALQEMTSHREIMAVVYLCREYEVKKEASLESDTVAIVPSGQTVFVQNMVLEEDGTAWIQVSFFQGDKEFTGYIEKSHLAISDEQYVSWEREWGLGVSHMPMTLSMVDDEGEMKSTYGDIVNQFPESYRPALDALLKVHPNWIFVPLNTGLDWNTVIENELKGGKSLVSSSYPVYTKEGVYDDNRWYYASREILELYMDPRNSLTENAIFQFEQLTYNESYHTKEALETFLNQTFMKSQDPTTGELCKAPETDLTYAQIFYAIGKAEDFRVSPFHLAARVYQEQGSASSPLISGKYPGYEHLYNYFNIGATGTSTTEVIKNGLTYARNANPVWNNAYYSIYGGAKFISANYIRKGQDSLYLQKYNVNPSASYALYTHQYMQNIAAPTSEAKKVRDMYAGANSLNCSFVFTIPVFQNMPQTPCPMPTASNNVVLQVPKGFDENTIYLDGIPYSSEKRNGQVIVKAPDEKASVAVAYQYNQAGVPIDMYVWMLSYEGNAYGCQGIPGLQNLLSYHGFSIRITGKAGIRYKTGISADIREQLLTSGIDGYVLKEYGTLVMNKANMTAYPLIKGGEKVSYGVAYGRNAEGTVEDHIFETVDHRYRFTSVLVGIPASQYKTEFAFRGYAILEKQGIQRIVYGPTKAQSIYSLAGQVLEKGTYPEGSDANVFLKKILEDAQ